MASHALLSASGSDRWLKCTRSVRAEEGIADKTSPYAEEGSLAHEIGELMINKYIGAITTQKYNGQIRKLKKHELYNEEMLEYCQSYADFCIMRLNDAAKTCPDSMVAVEQRLDFSRWVPEGFGTGDCTIVADGTLEIIDLKYGKGIKVEAENNSQMMLYALGAFNEFGYLYDIQDVRMTIVQPRLDSISSWVISTEELSKWTREYLVPRAKLAYAGEGEFCAGSHCQWCKIKATCRARAEANLELAKKEFAPAPTLSDEEIADILKVADELSKWAKDIWEHAFEEAKENGKVWPGFKLVRGRSNRVFTDTEKVADMLKSKGFEDIYTSKLKGIGALEKLVGKKDFGEILGDLVVKPEGKPVLVEVTDKRQAIDTSEFEKVEG